MDGDATYTLKWYNPRTNEFTSSTEITPNTTDINGKPAYKLEDKPDGYDWVVLVTKNK